MLPEQRAAAIQSAAFLALTGVLLFGAAGRIDLWNFWAYLAVMGGIFATSLVAIDPDLVRERMRPAGGRAPKGLYVMTAMMFFHFAIAGADRGRLHWSDTTMAPMIVGLILFALANLAFIWIMRVNRYFSSVVRIQTDRGQKPVTTGPYAWVRHPGYAAAFVLLPASGLALGSWLAVAAIALTGLPLLLWRTIGEDRMLRAELEGYDDYARRVRWRLMPGIW